MTGASVAGLAGTRVLVVGASAGIGRALAEVAIASDARVVLAARRRGALDEIVAGAGGGAAVAADITDAEQCEALAARTRAALGGPIDVVLNVTGVSVLRRIADTTDADWDAVLRTNVVGCNHLLRAVVPHVADHGIVAVFSSEDVARVRGGLGAYGASKAALEAMLAAWRHECAPLRFVCVALGATMPTSVSDGFDADLLTEMLDDWIRSGHIQNEFMATEDLARALLGMLAAALPYPGVGVEHLLLRSPSAVLGNPTGLRDQLAGHLDEH